MSKTYTKRDGSVSRYPIAYAAARPGGDGRRHGARHPGIERHACGEWVEVGQPCHVCSLRVCTCPHPAEWHGRYGCRGWSAPPGETPMACMCRSEVGQ